MIKIYHLIRKEDVSQVSGTGDVGTLVEFSDGFCVLKWNTALWSVELFKNKKTCLQIHGHENKSTLVYEGELR